MANLEHIVQDLSAPKRLDVYVSENLKLLSRSQFKNRLAFAFVNNKAVKASYLIKTGDVLQLSLRELPELTLTAENLFFSILYEDENILVIDKEQAVVVHPGAGQQNGTVVNGLLHYMQEKNLKNLSQGNERPGIVHRLDKDTSGVLVCALNDISHAFLSNEFKERRVKKRYLALVHNRPKEKSGTIETYIDRDPKNRKLFTVSNTGGRWAISSWKLLIDWGEYSLLSMDLKTGRTHQLRVHLKHIGCPIVGDPLYGRKTKSLTNATLMLHARRLGIRIPQEIEPEANRVIKHNWMVFTAAIPFRMKNLIRLLDRSLGRR